MELIDKPHVIFRGLKPYADQFEQLIEYVQQVPENINCTKIGTISAIDHAIVPGFNIQLRWDDSKISVGRRLTVAYTNNLNTVADYTQDQPVVANMDTILATLMQLYTGLRATKVYFVDIQGVEHTSDIYFVLPRE
jgi:hypothetical protein